MAALPSLSDEDAGESFFKIGEIRMPTDEDYDHFLSLSDKHDGWDLKCSRSDVTVWMKDIPGMTVKMLKVREVIIHVL